MLIENDFFTQSKEIEKNRRLNNIKNLILIFEINR
jgi:hypothetical protein